MLSLGWTAARKSANPHFTECRVFLFDQALLITEDASPNSFSSTELSGGLGFAGNSFPANFGRVLHGSGSHAHRLESTNSEGDYQRRRPLVTTSMSDEDSSIFSVNHASSHSYSGVVGGRSPGLRRTMNIRRHGSHLSSLDAEGGAVWPKFSWSSQHDPFRQSSYKFLHSVKVNRMTYMVSKVQSYGLSQVIRRCLQLPFSEA